MGAAATTRKLSFDNTSTLNPALNIEKPLDDDKMINLSTFEEDRLYKDKDLSCYEDSRDYWNHRMDALKREHQMINKIIEQEYEKTIEHTSKLFETPVVTHELLKKVQPCVEWRSKIIKCYEDNPHQPLVCAPIVQAFSNSVASCRMET